MADPRVGGGASKILYALNTMRRIGPLKAGKALNTRNTCKACGLGMGGQKGGMVNEEGEFPAVCNKSIQAQSTDIQPEIPAQLFADFPLAEFQALSPHELETLGRLNTPLHKRPREPHYRPITWDEAIALAAKGFAATAPERSFFYASGRSSNEAGFLFQLLARAYGTNNVTNCSYYCHQATSVGLQETIGTGTATVELEDLNLADAIVVIGANPASNHPRFIHKLKACRDRGGEVIIINPAKESGLVKFALPKSARSLIAGGSDIASEYLQPNINTDLAVLKALCKSIIERAWQNEEFIAQYTEGFQAFADDIGKTSWASLLASSGLLQHDIERVAKILTHARSPVFAWGMGVTHHENGSDNVEAIAALALLCGAMGRPGAGLLPLRGHSNVQGIGTIGVKPVLADEVVKKIEASYDIEFPRQQGLDTMASMQAAHAGQIDAALCMGGNLYAANPDTRWATEALNNIRFRVALTTTLNQSHVLAVDDSEMLILPVAARDEERQATTQESMFNFVRMSDGGIRRLDNVRPESDILADIASQLLPNSPIDFTAFKNHRSTREAIAGIVPGMADLASIDVAKKEFHINNRILHTPVFDTISGKAQLKTIPFSESTSAPDTNKPFMLCSVRSEGQFNSIIYEEQDSYRGTETRLALMMNRADIAALGLKQGDVVSVASDFGRLDGMVLHSFDLPRGNLMAYYPEANCLTGQSVDPRSRTPAFKSVRVSVQAP